MEPSKNCQNAILRTDVRHTTVEYRGFSAKAYDCEVEVCPVCGEFILTAKGEATRDKVMITLMQKYINSRGVVDPELWRLTVTKIDLETGDTTQIERFYSSYSRVKREMISAYSVHPYVSSSGELCTVYTDDFKQRIYRISKVEVHN